MNLIIESENIAKAVKDARLSLGGEVQVCMKKREGIANGQLITCDGSSQTHVLFKCEMDEARAEFIAGPEFLEIISKMAETGKVIEITRNAGNREKADCEDYIKVTCEGSEVRLGLKTEMKLFQMKQDESTISVKMSASDFRDAVAYGGYCASKDDNRGLKNVIELQFYFGTGESTEEGQRLCVQTTDFYKGAKMEVKDLRSFRMSNGKPQKVTGERVYALDCSKVQAMAGMLKAGEEVNILLNKGQVVFSNAGRIFIFRAFEKRYPDLSNIFKKKESSVQVTAKAADIKRAAQLISAVCDTEQNPVVLSHEKGELLLADEKRMSVNRIPAEIEGTFQKMGMKKEILILGLVKAASEKVHISISGPNSPFFIAGDRHEGIYFAGSVLLKKSGRNGSDKLEGNAE